MATAAVGFRLPFHTGNEMRICDKFQSKIHKTGIMLFSGEQSVPETEYLFKAVYQGFPLLWWLKA
ncbi:hypothetical protein FCZ47_23790 [Escherichia coli]|nr:hypothetical protein [Escherichia coli]